MEALLQRFRAYLHKLRLNFIHDVSEVKAEFCKDWDKIPNIITMIRLFLSPIPGLIILLSSNDYNLHWLAFWLFATIALTDKVDGHLARKLNQITRLGIFIDPVVDKVLVTMTFVSLIINSRNFFMTSVMATVVLCEIFVVWLSFIDRHKKQSMTVTVVGKFKMVVQCIAILFLIQPITLSELSYILIGIGTTIVTILSMSIYLYKFVTK